jgi:hypothetical protein
MVIDRVEEIQKINNLGRRIKESGFKIDKNTLLINICPSYSSICSQNLIHYLGDKYPLDMFNIETYEDGNYKGYELNFLNTFAEYERYYNNFILVEADVKTGNNYTWIMNSMYKDFGIERDRILTTALCLNKNSIFKPELAEVGYKDDIKFTWNLKQNYAKIKSGEKRGD